MLLAAAPAAAEPVLHEYVKPPHGKGGRIVNPDADAAGKSSSDTVENPAAFRHGDKILVEPPASEPERPSEVVHGEHGFAADRQTEARPDYATDGDGTLHYVEVFNPAIVPFKRMSALDRVADDYSLGVTAGPAQPVPSSGDTGPDRDLFWGSLIVSLPRGGGAVPIPSVAPEMRVLSYEAEPRIKLVFEKDHADNFSVRAADPRAGGQHRLVFLVDAPAVYFAARVPPGVPVRAIAAKRAPAPLPARARASARVVLEKIGIDPAMNSDEVLARLVEYFRGFRPGAPPAPSEDVYLDLALSRIGVCRHRAFAFMITANAAGIPARYVTNEAHAFAEVWVPDAGWLRIDLGGAARDLEIANASEKTIHQPRSADPFPKPRSYAENYTRLRGRVGGLSNEQLLEARRPAPAPGDEPPDPSSTDPVAPARIDVPRPAAAPGETRRRVPLVIDNVDARAFRGEPLRITGHLGDGDGPEGLRVDIYLAPEGARGTGARPVGQTATDGAGKFTIAIELPLDVLLGRYEVYAVTPGNAEIAPAISE